MLYSAPRFGAYTAEEVRRFYPLIENDFTVGYKHDCRLRIEFRQNHGLNALERYNRFTRTVLTTIPDYENTLPSLEQLLAAVAQLQTTATLPFILTTNEIAESSTKPKKSCCSIM